MPQYDADALRAQNRQVEESLQLAEKLQVEKLQVEKLQVENGGGYKRLIKDKTEKKKRQRSFVSDDTVPPYSEAFEQFWTAYPIKKEKREAWKQWRGLKLEPHAPVILAAVLTHCADDREWSAGYIPHPHRFLKYRRLGR